MLSENHVRPNDRFRVLVALQTLCLGALVGCGSSASSPAPSETPVLPTSTSPATAAGSTAPPPVQTIAGSPASSVPVTSPSTAGTGGAPSTQPITPPTTVGGAGGGTAATNPATTPTSTPTNAPQTGLAMDECGLKTTWRGDEYCIKPPPADKGFQLHIGPSSYDNPEAKFVMAPGGETVESFNLTSGNTSDVYYYWRQYRMRPGTHHVIVSSGGLGGRRLGGAQNLAYDNPDRGVIPPENQDVGMQLAANTPVNLNVHYINTTDKPILKEVWINFWYRDPADVKEAALEMYSFAPMNVPPGEHVVIHGDCPVMNDGRILTLYGHRHANNLRFSVWHTHGTDKTLVYEDYNWEDPLLLEFSSVDMNPAGDPSKKVPGGWSGMLNVMSGDSMSFECEIENMTNRTFVGQNEAKDDEMCIMIGDTVKSTVSPSCKYTTTQVTSQ